MDSLRIKDSVLVLFITLFWFSVFESWIKNVLHKQEESGKVYDEEGICLLRKGA